MNQRKPNISRWYALGLAAVIVAGCLILSIGTTFARYRSDTEEAIIFEPRVPISVTVSKLTESAALDTKSEIAWEKQTDGSMLLNFAVSNAIIDAAGGTTYQEEDIRVRVRLIGTLAAWSEEQTGKVILTDGTMTKDKELKEFTADIMRIPENTSLYYSFGDGWVFRFLDGEGEELTWILEGGALSCVEMNITMDASAFSGTSLLQLQIIGEVA